MGTPYWARLSAESTYATTTPVVIPPYSLLMTLDEFMSTLQRRSDYDGNSHVVATGEIPVGLRSSIRLTRSAAKGRMTEPTTEYFLSLMRSVPSWWIADNEELFFELGDETRVWPA